MSDPRVSMTVLNEASSALAANTFGTYMAAMADCSRVGSVVKLGKELSFVLRLSIKVWVAVMSAAVALPAVLREAMKLEDVETRDVKLAPNVMMVVLICMTLIFP